jgi:hypothetical protein
MGLVLHAQMEQLRQVGKLHVLLVILDAPHAQLLMELKFALSVKLIMATLMEFVLLAQLDKHHLEDKMHVQLALLDVLHAQQAMEQ